MKCGMKLDDTQGNLTDMISPENKSHKCALRKLISQEEHNDSKSSEIEIYSVRNVNADIYVSVYK